MAWALGTKHTVILVSLVMLGVGMSPNKIINRTLFLIYHTPSIIFSSVRVPPPAPHSLKAAILNVTADFNELAHLIQDFMRTNGVDPSTETLFREFLAERAQRSHPGLESALDWLLALYKFAFPFMIISLLAKLSSAASASQSSASMPVVPVVSISSGRQIGESNNLLRWEKTSLRRSTSPVGPDTPVDGNHYERGAPTATPSDVF